MGIARRDRPFEMVAPQSHVVPITRRSVPSLFDDNHTEAFDPEMLTLGELRILRSMLRDAGEARSFALRALAMKLERMQVQA